MKPDMTIIQLQQRVSILTGSNDNEGVNEELQKTEEVDYAW